MVHQTHITTLPMLVVSNIVPAHPQLCQVHLLDSYLSAHGLQPIVCSDVGSHQCLLTQYLRLHHPRQWLMEGGLASMGCGLPAAIGAALANPGATCLAVAGDGGFAMTSQVSRGSGSRPCRYRASQGLARCQQGGVCCAGLRSLDHASRQGNATRFWCWHPLHVLSASTLCP